CAASNSAKLHMSLNKKQATAPDQGRQPKALPPLAGSWIDCRPGSNSRSDAKPRFDPLDLCLDRGDVLLMLHNLRLRGGKLRLRGPSVVHDSVRLGTLCRRRSSIAASSLAISCLRPCISPSGSATVTFSRSVLFCRCATSRDAR